MFGHPRHMYKRPQLPSGHYFVKLKMPFEAYNVQRFVQIQHICLYTSYYLNYCDKITETHHRCVYLPLSHDYHKSNLPYSLTATHIPVVLLIVSTATG